MKGCNINIFGRHHIEMRESQELSLTEFHVESYEDTKLPEHVFCIGAS
jgi:hypothetical protein